jgi:hypothetical protein
MMIFRRWLRLPDGFLLARFVVMDLAILLVFYVDKTSLYGGIGAHGFHPFFGVQCTDFYVVII